MFATDWGFKNDPSLKLQDVGQAALMDGKADLVTTKHMEMAPDEADWVGFEKFKTKMEKMETNLSKVWEEMEKVPAKHGGAAKIELTRKLEDSVKTITSYITI